MLLSLTIAATAVLAARLGNGNHMDNMNGDYILSATPKGQDVNSKFPTHYKDYPRPVEYFEVYSPPITQLYSQVFWKGLPPVPLPADIIKKYSGKGMAVVGFEMDQVRQTPEGDVSVPITLAYNHHFESTMGGRKSSFEHVQFTGEHDPRLLALLKEREERGMGGHGLASHEEHWMLHDLAPNNPLPTSTSFGAANGGEYRKSFHGYAPGFAQLIDSPTNFQITPMQIDTWNRDKMNLTGPSPMVPGPLPRSSLAPAAAKHPNYSGLLECPLTTRITKSIDINYDLLVHGACPDKVLSATECFTAADKFFGGGVNTTSWSGTDAALPDGCSFNIVAGAPGVVAIYYNEKGAGSCADNSEGLTAGHAHSLVDVKVRLDAVKGEVTLTLTGPDVVWFGVGFGAQAMGDQPWTVVVDGAGNVTEHKLKDQNPGTVLPTSVVVVSNEAKDGQRTVVLTRAMKGKTSDYFTFTPSGILPIINAVGSGPAFAYHKNKAAAKVTLVPLVSPARPHAAAACLCTQPPPAFGDAKGKLVYTPVAGQPGEAGQPSSVLFPNHCAPQPRTDLLAMKNPTCDVRTYAGGQTACHHMWSLLDADQEIPWVDQPLEYHLKFRFWVQEYNSSYHTNVKRTTWGIASPVEYDVPKCKEGMMGCSLAKDGTWIHTITGTYKGGGKLVAAHFHCHAPTCLSMTMYRNDTGEVICEERPVYGGKGQIDLKKFDEPGYIAQPPCLWGSPAFGLQEPLDVTGVTLHTVKTSNASYGHHGEMAWQQMFYV